MVISSMFEVNYIKLWHLRVGYMSKKGLTQCEMTRLMSFEFLIHLKWYGEREQGENQSPIRVEEVVTEAHEALKKKGKEE